MRAFLLIITFLNFPPGRPEQAGPRNMAEAANSENGMERVFYNLFSPLDYFVFLNGL